MHIINTKENISLLYVQAIHTLNTRSTHHTLYPRNNTKYTLKSCPVENNSQHKQHVFSNNNKKKSTENIPDAFPAPQTQRTKRAHIQHAKYMAHTELHPQHLYYMPYGLFVN